MVVNILEIDVSKKKKNIHTKYTNIKRHTNILVASLLLDITSHSHKISTFGGINLPKYSLFVASKLLLSSFMVIVLGLQLSPLTRHQIYLKF